MSIDPNSPAYIFLLPLIISLAAFIYLVIEMVKHREPIKEKDTFTIPSGPIEYISHEKLMWWWPRTEIGKGYPAYLIIGFRSTEKKGIFIHQFLSQLPGLEVLKPESNMITLDITTDQKKEDQP